MTVEKPHQQDIRDRMKNITTEYTRRERIQDAIVRLVIQLGRALTFFRRRKP
jgi:hypothetical protein